MEAAVFSIEAKETGRSVDLSESIFGLEAPNDHAIYQDVKLILANQRQGTHKAKERGEIAGSKKKPYRQKGTGNARAGSRKSPIWRHGGRIFGPRPRSYSFKLNKKTRALARMSALTYKAQEARIKVIENFEFDAPKTKQFLEILRNFELEGQKILFVLPEDNKNIYLSGRNVPKANVATAKDINTYDILNADALLIMEDAIGVINERFLSKEES